MTEVSIRSVDASELRQLAQIGRRTFIDTFANGNRPQDFADYLDTAFSLNQLEREMGDANSSFYFAMIGDSVVGYLKLNTADAQTEEVQGETLEIERIYVDAQMQGKGVGKALFEFALDIARQIEAEAVWLGVWEHNTKALEFYTRQGFIPFGEHEFKIGQDVQLDKLLRFELRS